MKYLRLYDLRNETVTVIPYSRTPLTVARTPRDLEAKKRKVGRRIIRWVKHAALAVAEFAVSLASGLIFFKSYLSGCGKSGDTMPLEVNTLRRRSFRCWCSVSWTMS